jgi:hypothetical protein
MTQTRSVVPVHLFVASLLGWLHGEHHKVVEYLSWQTFLRAHWGALLAADFFATEIWMLRGATHRCSMLWAKAATFV